MLNLFTFLYIEALTNLPLVSQFLNNKQGIYMLFYVDPKGVLHNYIGSSVDIGRRIPEHVLDARPGQSNYHVHNSMRHYGIHCFNVGVLSFLPDVSLDTLQAVEREYITKFKPSLNMTNGTNCFSAGSAPKPVLVTDLNTLEVTKYPSVKGAARALGIDPRTLREAIQKGYTVLKQYKVKYATDC